MKKVFSKEIEPGHGGIELVVNDLYDVLLRGRVKEPTWRNLLVKLSSSPSGLREEVKQPSPLGLIVKRTILNLGQSKNIKNWV